MIIAISPFADSEVSGHSLLDDEFYFEYLLNLKKPFRFYTPLVSAQRLEAHFPKSKDQIVAVKAYKPNGWGHLRFARQLKVERGAKVIFFGYLEPLVILWYVINLTRPFGLWLVVTNNISARRVSTYSIQMKLFFRVIRRKLKRIVVHTDYEVRLLDSLKEGLGEISRVKKHHLMAPIHQKLTEPFGRKIKISFFGPAKHDKPIEPFLHLIASDRAANFNYFIHNHSEADILAKMQWPQLPEHVTVIEGWLGYQAHLENCAAADIIFMAHNRDFEGKLSGNLCDCIALGVPYISCAMEPMLSLHQRYGVLGYISNFDQPQWAEQLLLSIDWRDLLEKREALQNMAEDFSVDRILADLDEALCLKDF